MEFRYDVNIFQPGDYANQSYGITSELSYVPQQSNQYEYVQTMSSESYNQCGYYSIQTDYMDMNKFNMSTVGYQPCSTMMSIEAYQDQHIYEHATCATEHPIIQSSVGFSEDQHDAACVKEKKREEYARKRRTVRQDFKKLFEKLRSTIPDVPKWVRLTRSDILRLAITQIQSTNMDAIGRNNSSPNSQTNVSD